MSNRLDDFLREQGSGDDPSAQAGPQWELLKEYVAKLEGKEHKQHPFSWMKNGSMLALEDVVAAFGAYPLPNSYRRGYRVVFSRRPPEAHEAFSEDAPHQVEWGLEPKIQGTEFLWHVDDLNKALPSSDLADEISIRLAEYRNDYHESISLGGRDLGD